MMKIVNPNVVHDLR